MLQPCASCRCTGVVAIVKDRQVWIAHVGDSRAVLVKPNGQGVTLKM